MTSTYYEPIEFEGVDAIDAESAKPDGQILCYPVIKLLGKGVAHLGSGKNLLDDKQAEMGEALSPDLIADETAPKAFIWHTFNDGAVNVINSLDYAKRLRQMNVPVEMHIYPEGPHGLGLAPAYPHVADWAERLIAWLKFYEEKENG
jgi:acetyl esterase/lipase